MSFPRYPKYKPSGVEWLGDVPEHWEVLKLKHIATVENAGSYGSDVESSLVQCPVATTAQIDPEGRFDVESMPIRGFESSELEIVGCREGDILVVKSSGSAANIISGKCGLVGASTPYFAFSNFLMRVRAVHSRVCAEFLFALLRSPLTRARVELMCATTTYPNLQVGEYCGSWLPTPPLSEQKAISTFLDRETSKIDALVSEQERLIDLLKEKRQAVISHAVTKGLNPHVKMKPSGVEWLGDVPEHWEVVKFGQRLRSNPCYGVLVPDFDPSGIPMLRITDMNAGVVELDDLTRISRGLSDVYARTLLELGDIALSVVGTIGEVLIVGPSLVGANLSRAVARVRVSSTTSVDLACWWIRTPQFIRYTDLVCVGSAQRVLNMADLRSFRIALGSMEEQLAISTYLDRETSKFDTLCAEAERAIALLKERRSALISAAVTGQIDVRGAVPA